jgi:hypothetical protein
MDVSSYDNNLQFFEDIVNTLSTWENQHHNTLHQKRFALGIAPPDSVNFINALKGFCVVVKPTAVPNLVR